MTETAPAPFNNPDADLILCSSDNVQFRVFKSLISFASPIFHDMLRLPQPAENEGMDASGIPSIPMSETSDTLEKLLHFCYPMTMGARPMFHDPMDVVTVLQVARKYDMNGPEDLARKSILAPNFATAAEAFIIARQFGWVEEAKLAARLHLEHELVPDDSPVFAHGSSKDIIELLRYHKACQKATHVLGDDFSWFSTVLQNQATGSKMHKWITEDMVSFSNLNRDTRLPHSVYIPGNGNVRWDISGWLVTVVQQVILTLSERPCRKTVMDALPKFFCAAQAQRSPRSQLTVEVMPDFVEAFADAVDKKILSVESNLK